MNEIYRRMFENPECSLEEAKVLAAALGKTYEQCRTEWEDTAKQRFILDNIGFLTSYNFKADIDNKYVFNFTFGYVDSEKFKTIGKYDNVNVKMDYEYKHMLNQYGYSYSYPTGSTASVTVTFIAGEIDENFLSMVNSRIEEYRNGMSNGFGL